MFKIFPNNSFYMNDTPITIWNKIQIGQLNKMLISIEKLINRSVS